MSTFSKEFGLFLRFSSNSSEQCFKCVCVCGFDPFFGTGHFFFAFTLVTRLLGIGSGEGFLRIVFPL